MKFVVGLGVDESLMVVAGNDEVGVVGQECLPILLALDKMTPVVEQMQIIVDHTVFDFPFAQFQGCW